MTSFKRILITILAFQCIVNLYGQKDPFQIKNYSERDSIYSSSTYDYVVRFISQKEIFPISDLKSLIPNLLNQSVFKSTNSIFLKPVSIRPEFKSLVFLEMMTPDTINSLQDERFVLLIFNFNKDRKLISSCEIPVYEKVNSGLSFSGLDTDLSFPNNSILIKETHVDHPTDMSAKYKITEDSFKSKKEHSIFMNVSGNLTLTK